MLYGIERFFDVFNKQAIYLNSIPTDNQMSFILPITTDEIRLLKLRFNQDGTYKDSLRSIGKEYGVTGERIRQRIEKALRKLRQPSRSEDLIGFLNKEKEC
jgi:DNA-directed RNA polymerase sigma subunit (sigma70/sigma32)